MKISNFQDRITNILQEKLKGKVDQQVTTKTLSDIKKVVDQTIMDELELAKKPRIGDLSVNPTTGQCSFTCKVPLVLNINLLSDDETTS